MLKRQRRGEQNEGTHVGGNSISQNPEDLGENSFVGQFVTKILNNLQITVQNLHLRYEDTGSNKTPFAFGVTLEKLKIYTTDAEWKETFLTEEQVKQKIIYKVESKNGVY